MGQKNDKCQAYCEEGSKQDKCQADLDEKLLEAVLGVSFK